MHVPFFGLNLFIIQSIYKRFTNESNVRIGCPIARLNGQNIRFVTLGFTVRTVVFHLAYNMIADAVFVRKPAVKLQFVGRWDNGACKETIRIYFRNYYVAGRILFDFFGR